MEYKIPILMSFYALSGKDSTLIFGQVTYTKIKDLSFKDYSRRKTFRTLLSLYRTKPYAGEPIEIHFDKGKVHVKTDTFGSFKLVTGMNLHEAKLQQVTHLSGAAVKIIEGLYPQQVQQVKTDMIVVSDIDDTLLHSFIFRKIKKFRTLVFTTVEKRKTVTDMQALLQQFTNTGAAPFYVSNSEQNLYPMIYRFLLHNGFPSGPLFLKKMRKLWDVLWNIKFPLRNVHKEETLEELLSLFPDKKFILMGDNTQHDLPIYINVAERYPHNIRYIIIRRVVDRREDDVLLQKHTEKSNINNTRIYYADQFPRPLEL